MPSSDSAVGIVSGVTKDRWEFVQSTQQSFQIVSVDTPEKCLANINDEVCLVTVSSSFLETTQFWYLTESQGGYIIENVASHEKLSVSTQNGALTCTLSDEEQVWTFMDYDVPEVAKIKNVALNQYLQNATGKNYNEQEIVTNTDSYASNYDKCGFRMVYYVSDAAYMIMPISSGNGHQRALTARSATAASTSSMMLHKCTDSYRTRQLFLLELQSNGSYVIKLKNTPSLVLTANGTAGNTTGTVTMSVRTDALTNQTWNLSEYEAYLPKSTGDTEYPKISYAKLEQYYNSLEFLSPLGEFETTIVSDYGYRNSTGSKVHKGIDLRTRTETSETDHYRNLYAPISGTVVKVENSGSSMGLYLKIDTGIPAFPGSNYPL